MTSIRNPIGTEKSNVEGAISILDIYGPLSMAMSKISSSDPIPSLQKSSLKGVAWANSGERAMPWD